jgi:anthranilate synthase component 1
MTEGLEGAIAQSVAELARAAISADIVPVALEVHADSLTPVGAFERFVGGRAGFLLESVEDGQRFGRFSFLGRRPLGVCEVWADATRASGVFESSDSTDPLKIVEEYLESTVVADVVGETSSPVPLRTGVVGVFGWDTVRSIERLPPRTSTSSPQPDAALMAIGELVVFDHWRQTLTLIVNVDTRSVTADTAAEGLGDEVAARLRQMVADLSRPAPEFLRPARTRHEHPVAPHSRTMSSEQYESMVSAAKEKIAEGEVFQIVLSQRYDLGPMPDAFESYRVLRQMNPSAYLYFLQFDGLVVSGSSPEALVRVRDGRVTIRPIAGSRPRSDVEHENALRAASLAEDPKEVAEHVMLVDLGRNDVGRVAQFGSVVVEELMTVETYSHIMHLTSQVSGDLRDGVGAVDVLRATFPAGTLSGAPKVRAMELITEMEPEARGLYGGAVGYFDFSGNFDAAIVIRTLVVDRHGNGSVQTGAGIVWDSDPKSEDEECMAKAEAVLRAVGGARA